MEKLKSRIPETLIHSISQSNPNTLPNTCSSLHDFLNQLPLFHQLIEDLAHKETSLFLKNKQSALEFKLKGNNCFTSGDYPNALRFYSQALRAAPTGAEEMGKNLVATLYVNRAAVLQKIGLVRESLRDCNRALAICKSYSKAWYRRSKANTSMGNFDDAVCDLKVSLCTELSVSGKRQIGGELKLILAQHHGKDSSSPDVPIYDESNILDQLPQIQLQCVSTESKGRGMVSLTDIPQTTLLHKEEPYAAIVSKHCRETYCHFCFIELPADTVPCPSCSMALYCSRLCQLHARGYDFHTNMNNHGKIDVDLSRDLEKYVATVTKDTVDGMHNKQTVEHKHECGVNWPAALPAEVVLAGRVIGKFIEEHRHIGESSSIVNLELCHNYLQLDPESKLELHISSIVLLKCLHKFYGSDVSLKGDTISQCVLLLSQLNVNSMAIVRMRSADTVGLPSSIGNHTTSAVEQISYEQSLKLCGILHCGFLSNVTDALTLPVALTHVGLEFQPNEVRVGQAIYLGGSLFNHSCQPNIHTYFFSRTLYIRAINSVTAGHPLELSYGPQVGQWSCNERKSSLKEQYGFVCSCTSCSQLNLSDLVINSFRCVNSNCSGVIMDSSVVDYENQKVNPFLCGLQRQVDRFEHDGVKRVASLLCEHNISANCIKPGICLSCGNYRDLEASNAVVEKAEISIRRLMDSLASAQLPTNILSSAVRSLDLLKSLLHPYNKKLAEVEDYLAQAYTSIGDLKQARDHCQASIKILEKLYGHDHIVIGNEFVKLASVQLSLGESAAEETINLINLIFSRHYGPDVEVMFPHLQFLKSGL